ncbi:hypothetical protein [Actinoplanes sp. NPDC020271]|uniref:hypothetical protein n=1 Tax=Actinoplanes sp. NPDC020271 TaxID=3363896 RepID=UPI0037953DC9
MLSHDRHRAVRGSAEPALLTGRAVRPAGQRLLARAAVLGHNPMSAQPIHDSIIQDPLVSGTAPG